PDVVPDPYRSVRPNGPVCSVTDSAPTACDAASRSNSRATERETTRETVLGTAEGSTLVSVGSYPRCPITSADASSRSPSALLASAVVRSLPSRATTSATVASATAASRLRFGLARGLRLHLGPVLVRL